MASGVLVGAMLVLWLECASASSNCLHDWWNSSINHLGIYAQGIIEVMERYHAEALLPVIIGIVVLLLCMCGKTSNTEARELLRLV